MLFNSATYLFLFLPLVVVLYWRLPLRGRQWLILAASLTFYGFWRVEFIPLLLFSALLDYGVALGMERLDENPRARKKLLFVSMAANLTILGFFKYLIFFRDSIWSLAEVVGYHPSYVELNIILPLGISFYIFQTMSYTIDVYRREFPAERDVLSYLSYVTFFPQLVAGPILRPSELLPQLKTKQMFAVDDLRAGLERIVAGLFMKMVLADSIAEFVNAGFDRDLASLSAYDAWTLAFLFGFQIYFDFAGYSSIAIGSGRLMGFRIRENFDFPYAATSPREFWKRWHISLSTWIRDYLYLPIVGAYRSQAATAWDTMADDKASTAPASRRTWGLFLTWGIMGLWHGAAWTFVLWGLYHAAIVYFHRKMGGIKLLPSNGLGWLLSIAITLPLMMAGWIPFRANSLGDTFEIWGLMVNPAHYHGLSLSPNSYFLALALTVGVTLRYWWVESPAQKWVATKPVGAPFAIGYHALGFALVLLYLQVKSSFIYFQF